MMIRKIETLTKNWNDDIKKIQTLTENWIWQ